MEARSKWETKKVGTAAGIWKHQNPQLKVLRLVLTHRRTMLLKNAVDDGHDGRAKKKKKKKKISHCFSNFIYTLSVSPPVKEIGGRLVRRKALEVELDLRIK